MNSEKAAASWSFARQPRVKLLAEAAVWMLRSVPLLLTVQLHAATEDLVAQPSFDCTRAEAVAEQLVCRDQELALLDRQLAAIYATALKNADRDGWGTTLKAEQRGWVKGRNDCWKADDLRSCVEQEYKHRISEFQAKFRLVPSRGPYFFTCDDRPANEVVITYFESLLPSGIIERADRTVVLYASPSGSGAKYEGRNVLFWEHQGEAAVEWDGEQLRCVLRNN